MNIERDNVEERQRRVDAILGQVRDATRPLPARIRRVASGLGGVVNPIKSIPLTGRRLPRTEVTPAARQQGR